MNSVAQGKRYQPFHHVVILLIYKNFDLIIVKSSPATPPTPPSSPTKRTPHPIYDRTIRRKKVKVNPIDVPNPLLSLLGMGIAAFSLLCMGDRNFDSNKTKSRNLRNEVELHSKMITGIKKKC